MKHLKRASELLQFGGRTTDDEIDSDDKKLEQLKDKDATLLKKNSSKKKRSGVDETERRDSENCGQKTATE